MRFKNYLNERQELVTSTDVSDFVDKWKSKMNSMFGATFDFSTHFVRDSLNNKRNIKPITVQELDFVLNGFLHKFGSQFKKDVDNVKNHTAKPRGKNKKDLNQNELEFIITSRSTNISLVFVLKQDFHKKGTAVLLPITIIRKKNFKITKGEEIIVEKENIMKFKRYITEKKAELSGDQYKDKFISLLNKWDTDFSRMTKAYKNLKAVDSKEFLEKGESGEWKFNLKKYNSNSDVKEFRKLRQYFITFAKNFENWVYTKILDNRKIKDEDYYQTQMRKTAWIVYINLSDGTLFPRDYIYKIEDTIDAPWLLDTTFRNNSRKTNITRYQNAWRKFKEAFIDMVRYESEKIEDIKDEQIQISGVNISIKNKPNDKKSDEYIKDMISHLRKVISIIKKEGVEKSIKGFRIEYNFNTSTVRGLPDGGALTSGAYDKDKDVLYLFPLSRDKITDSTLIHEIGHRYWFKYIPNRAQKAWEDKINNKVVTVEKEHIQKFFDMFYDKEKYHGFLSKKEVEREVEKIKDPTLKIIFNYLADNKPYFEVKDGNKYDVYFDFMVKRAKGEQIPLEWISEYGRTNPVEAFAEAFKIWVGGQKSRLGPWTRAFFKEIVSTGGSNIKEETEMNLIEKYLGEASKYIEWVKSNKKNPVKFKIGDKVIITTEGLQIAHSRTPAHMGYMQTQIDYYHKLYELSKKKVKGTVTHVFSSGGMNVDFEGTIFDIKPYMVKKV